jgi:hypothetical protein
LALNEAPDAASPPIATPAAGAAATNPSAPAATPSPASKGTAEPDKQIE